MNAYYNRRHLFKFLLLLLVLYARLVYANESDLSSATRTQGKPAGQIVSGQPGNQEESEPVESSEKRGRPTGQCSPETIDIKDDPEGAQSPAALPAPAHKNYAEIADAFHRMISERLLSSANWIDSFFRDERSEIEENHSILRLRFSSFLEDGEGIKSEAQVRLRLVLPGLQDKFHIIVSGEKYGDVNIREEPLVKTSEIDQDAERNVNLSLRYFVKAAQDKNLSLKVGSRLNSFSPVVYTGPRFRISKQFDPWLVRFTQEILYFSDDGWECSSDFDFERALTKSLFFRHSLEGYWFEQEDGYFYDLKLSVFQVIDGDRAIEYAWNNYFVTRPSNQLDEILVWVKYRQRFWRQWLFFEIKPQIAFREEDDYHPTPGITFTLESVFGNKEW